MCLFYVLPEIWRTFCTPKLSCLVNRGWEFSEDIHHMHPFLGRNNAKMCLYPKGLRKLILFGTISLLQMQQWGFGPTGCYTHLRKHWAEMARAWKKHSGSLPAGGHCLWPELDSGRVFEGTILLTAILPTTYSFFSAVTAEVVSQQRRYSCMLHPCVPLGIRVPSGSGYFALEGWLFAKSQFSLHPQEVPVPPAQSCAPAVVSEPRNPALSLRQSTGFAQTCQGLRTCWTSDVF